MNKYKNECKIYFSPGIFFELLLEARSGEGHEKINEADLLQELMKVFLFNKPDFHFGDYNKFKSNTSKIKNSKANFSTYLEVDNDETRTKFDKDVKSKAPKTLEMMKAIIRNYLICDELYKPIRAMIDLILRDDSIPDDTEFYIFWESFYITKEMMRDKNALETVIAEPFLLGIWHYLILHRYNTNTEGATTYKTLFGDGSYNISFKNPKEEKSRPTKVVLLANANDIDYFQYTKQNDFQLDERIHTNIDDLKLSAGDLEIKKNFFAEHKDIMLRLIRTGAIHKINLLLKIEYLQIHQKTKEIIDVIENQDLKITIETIEATINQYIDLLYATDVDNETIFRKKINIERIYRKFYTDAHF